MRHAVLCVLCCAVLFFRRKKLEVDSRTWIAPEDLQARIEAALDNPLHL
jgi:hypothetical protein